MQKNVFLESPFMRTFLNKQMYKLEEEIIAPKAETIHSKTKLGKKAFVTCEYNCRCYFGGSLLCVKTSIICCFKTLVFVALCLHGQIVSFSPPSPSPAPSTHTHTYLFPVFFPLPNLFTRNVSLLFTNNTYLQIVFSNLHKICLWILNFGILNQGHTITKQVNKSVVVYIAQTRLRFFKPNILTETFKRRAHFNVCL